MPLSSSLALYAPDCSVGAEHARLIDTLGSIGLIGEPLASFQFLAGERFFNHITFLGCAPNIPLLPEQGDQYLRISVPALSSPQLFSAGNARTPVCTGCGQPLEQWKVRIGKNRNGELECEACHASLRIHDLNIGKKSCFTQSIVQITPIFESEAVPSASLLNTLEEQLGTPFHYAYI